MLFGQFKREMIDNHQFADTQFAQCIQQAKKHHNKEAQMLCEELRNKIARQQIDQIGRLDLLERDVLQTVGGGKLHDVQT